MHKPLEKSLKLKSIVASSAFLLTTILSSCGEPALTPEQAAITPCKTVKLFAESFLVPDLSGAASYATVASSQFEDISSLDTQFARFAVVMSQASDDAVVDDIGGYSDMLDYCKTKW